jgi:hypothetical protein
LEKINKIEKLLTNLTTMRREKNQINKIRNKKGMITTNTRKSKESLGNIMKTNSQINWKI